jgi:hypothetical protein
MLYPLMAAAKLRREPQRASNGEGDSSAPPVAPRTPSEIADASTTAHLRQLVAGAFGDALHLRKIIGRKSQQLAGGFNFLENSLPRARVVTDLVADIFWRQS